MTICAIIDFDTEVLGGIVDRVSVELITVPSGVSDLNILDAIRKAFRYDRRFARHFKNIVEKGLLQWFEIMPSAVKRLRQIDWRETSGNGDEDAQADDIAAVYAAFAKGGPQKLEFRERYEREL